MVLLSTVPLNARLVLFQLYHSALYAEEGFSGCFHSVHLYDLQGSFGGFLAQLNSCSQVVKEMNTYL